MFCCLLKTGLVLFQDDIAFCCLRCTSACIYYSSIVLCCVVLCCVAIRRHGVHAMILSISSYGHIPYLLPDSCFWPFSLISYAVKVKQPSAPLLVSKDRSKVESIDGRNTQHPSGYFD